MSLRHASTLLPAIGCALLLPACFALPSATSARTLPKGALEVAAVPGVVLEQDGDQGVGAPWLGASARYGLADGLEIGARASFGVMADAKLRLFDSRLVAASAGLGLGIDSDHLLGEVPLAFDFGPADGLRLTCALKWVVTTDQPWRLAGDFLEKQGPAGEVAVSIPMGARWTLRPFGYAALGRTQRAAPPGSEGGSGHWTYNVTGGGLAVVFR